MEPDKCEGWEWVSWEDAKRYSHSQTHPEARRLFLPILDLIKQRVGFDPVAEYTRSR